MSAVAGLRQVVGKEARRIRNLLYHRLHVSRDVERDVVTRFHQLYYDAQHYGKTWGSTFWLGVRTLKCPLDLWGYQELIHALRPDLVVECGTAHGGSALFLASMCDLVGHGHVLTIDIEERPGRPVHPRIEYVRGSSVSPEVRERVGARIRPRDTVLVILDSDHHKAHVLAELRAYGPLVSPGSYVIVEDTNLNGHPVAPEFGPGPMEAVDEFLAERSDFVVDAEREKFLLTFNPRGWLKRVR
jgi:cephalosporin hydroxylase